MKYIIGLFTCILIFSTSEAFAQPGSRLRERIQERQGVLKNGSASAPDVAPDYSNISNWASHPLKHDPADSIPAFLANEKRDSSVDVFFLHPTSFTKDPATAAWNANINDETLNTETDNRTILYQASVFNGSCKVYAPRYRQAHLKSFLLVGNPNSKAALDLAYQDLKSAFEYYLKNYNKGRPIIIASHSQGSLHALRLLKEFFEGKPLQKQLVCAYVVGWQIKKDEFTSIPFGKEPTATGCIVGWRTYRSGTTDRVVVRENGNSLCVNPVTWLTNNEEAPRELHKGMVGRNLNLLMPKSVSAQVDTKTNVLWAHLPEMIDEGLKQINNYHIADYNLFYMDIRQNVKQRIDAYFNKR